MTACLMMIATGAGLGLTALSGTAVAQISPEGSTGLVGVDLGRRFEHRTYVFEADGQLRLSVDLELEHARRADLIVDRETVGFWRLNEVGAVIVRWETGEVRRCESWPQYGYEVALDTVDNGTCWLSDELIVRMPEIAYAWVYVPDHEAEPVKTEGPELR